MHSLMPFSIALVAMVATLATLVAAIHGEGLPNDGKPLYFDSGVFALITLFFAGLGIKLLREDIARGFKYESHVSNEAERAEYLQASSRKFAWHSIGHGVLYAFAGYLGFGLKRQTPSITLFAGVLVVVIAIVCSLISLNRSATNFAHAVIRLILMLVIASLVAFTLLVLFALAALSIKLFM